MNTLILTVNYDFDWGEYIVKDKDNVNYYHTDCLKDAVGTAKAICRDTRRSGINAVIIDKTRHRNCTCGCGYKVLGGNNHV